MERSRCDCTGKQIFVADYRSAARLSRQSVKAMLDLIKQDLKSSQRALELVQRMNEMKNKEAEDL